MTAKDVVYTISINFGMLGKTYFLIIDDNRVIEPSKLAWIRPYIVYGLGICKNIVEYILFKRYEYRLRNPIPINPSLKKQYPKWNYLIKFNIMFILLLYSIP